MVYHISDFPFSLVWECNQLISTFLIGTEENKTKSITVFCFSRDNDFDYLEFRLWIGLWTALFCLLLVATDASFLVQYFTRFTEEGFSSLISFIFIYDAFKKMLKMADYYPINSDYKLDYVTLYGCTCMPSTPGKNCFFF